MAYTEASLCECSPWVMAAKVGTARGQIRKQERVKLVVAFNDVYAARRWRPLLAVFAGLRGSRGSGPKKRHNLSN